MQTHVDKNNRGKHSMGVFEAEWIKTFETEKELQTADLYLLN